MSDGPPNWDDIPPADYGQPSGGGGGNRGGKKPRPPAMTAQEMATASGDFYAWLGTAATQAQLKVVLPDHVDLPLFIATAKTAVLTKPQLLRENMRPSLLVAIMKAASQGLLPDGKQGALVPRYDNEAGGYIVAWQPMVQGIIKLGRETGAIKSIRAMIVFRGENFHVLGGEEDRIQHEIDIDIVDEAYAALNGGRDNHGNPIARPAEFFARVRAAYCFITGVDGTVTRRYMPHQRLVSLWESSKAANGPWNSRWIDEMILKGVILYTAKWINLDSESAPAKRFNAALMTDMEIDFDRQGQLTAPVAQPQAALPAPGDKLSTLEDAIMGRVTNKTVKPRETVASGSNNPSGSKPATAKPREPPAGDTDFLPRVLAVLEREGSGRAWMNALTAATIACPTAGELGEIRKAASVVANLKDAPPEVRPQIAALFVAAAQRLAEPQSDGAEDGAWNDPAAEIKGKAA